MSAHSAPCSIPPPRKLCGVKFPSQRQKRLKARGLVTSFLGLFNLMCQQTEHQMAFWRSTHIHAVWSRTFHAIPSPIRGCREMLAPNHPSPPRFLMRGPEAHATPRSRTPGYHWPRRPALKIFSSPAKSTPALIWRNSSTFTPAPSPTPNSSLSMVEKRMLAFNSRIPSVAN